MRFSPKLYCTPFHPKELLMAFEALVAETGETSQRRDAAGKQVVSFVDDNGASNNDFPSSAYIINYVECDRTVSTATGEPFPIEAYGDIRVDRLSAARTAHSAGKPRVQTYVQAQSVFGRSDRRPLTLCFIGQECIRPPADIRNACMFPKINTGVHFLSKLTRPSPENVLLPSLRGLRTDTDSQTYCSTLFSVSGVCWSWL